MRIALKEAHLALEAGEVPIGAVLVAHGRIVGRGHNHVERLQDPTAHAEMLAITSAVDNLGAKYLTDCTLYVTLEPCVMCMGALRWAQVHRIVYAAPDDKAGYRHFAPNAPHPKTRIEEGPYREEAIALLQDFFAQRR